MNANLKVDLDARMTVEKLARLEESITQQFVEEALEKIEAASKVSREGLIDSLHDFFANLRATLAEGESPVHEKISAQIGSSHGKVRANQRCFTRDEIFAEYRILTRVIFRGLRHEAHLSVEVEDVITDTILLSLGNAVASYLEFKDHFTKDYKNLERLRLIRALEHSNAELERFFAEAESPMFITVGRNHRCVLANSAFEEVAGRDIEGDLLGKVFEVERARDFLEGMDATFKKKESILSDVAIAGKGHFRAYLHPYLDLHGEVKGVMGLLQNIKVQEISSDFIHQQMES